MWQSFLYCLYWRCEKLSKSHQFDILQARSVHTPFKKWWKRLKILLLLSNSVILFNVIACLAQILPLCKSMTFLDKALRSWDDKKWIWSRTCITHKFLYIKNTQRYCLSLAQPLEVIKALAILKKCAAKVNTEIAGLDEKISWALARIEVALT